MEEVERTITVEEYREWNAYFSIKEKRVDKQDIYLARIAYILSCVHSKGPKKFKDFLLDQRTQEEKVEEDVAVLTAWATSINSIEDKKAIRRAT